MPYIALRSEELKDFSTDSDSTIIIVGRVLDNTEQMRINFNFHHGLEKDTPYYYGYCEDNDSKCFYGEYNCVKKGKLFFRGKPMQHPIINPTLFQRQNHALIVHDCMFAFCQTIGNINGIISPCLHIHTNQFFYLVYSYRIFQNKKVWDPNPPKFNLTAFGRNDDFEIRIRAHNGYGYTLDLMQPGIPCEPQPSTQCANANVYFERTEILFNYMTVIKT
jgi:hypothetical protein